MTVRDHTFKSLNLFQVSHGMSLAAFSALPILQRIQDKTRLSNTEPEPSTPDLNTSLTSLSRQTSISGLLFLESQDSHQGRSPSQSQLCKQIGRLYQPNHPQLRLANFQLHISIRPSQLSQFKDQQLPHSPLDQRPRAHPSVSQLQTSPRKPRIYSRTNTRSERTAEISSLNSASLLILHLSQHHNTSPRSQ